ncbi:MAG TPA: flagellar basal body protein, partial [Oscillospiraceae bacterium]|nr:flagellar basal body protein [Oscillospiraceae bacterium]
MALRPTFLAFETSRKSIMSAQKALDITGNNIGNINTQGYTRQRVDFFSVASTSGGLRYSSRVPLAGQGVYAAGVKQVRDPFLDRRYRELQADSSTYEITAGILTDIEDVLDNIENTGLQDSILDFQEKLQAFSSGTADGIELANIARTSAQNVTQMLRDYDKKLNQIMDQTKFELSTAVDNVNSIIEKLSALNVQIKDEYNR